MLTEPAVRPRLALGLAAGIMATRQGWIGTTARTETGAWDQCGIKSGSNEKARIGGNRA